MMDQPCQCSEDSSARPNAILLGILNRGRSARGPRTCPCEKRRLVRLQSPEETCRAASDVLVKTVGFVRNLPAFHQLPPRDQLCLLQNCWAALFIVGLAQDAVRFQVDEAPAPGLLEQILRDEWDQGVRLGDQPSLAGVRTLQACLETLWSLDLSPKEFAYLKGTVIFNPDIAGLKTHVFVEALQYEAQNALMELLLLLYPHDRGRFTRILLSASTLKSVTPGLLTELFFRPVIGSAHMPHLLEEMLYCS